MERRKNKTNRDKEESLFGETLDGGKMLSLHLLTFRDFSLLKTTRSHVD